MGEMGRAFDGSYAEYPFVSISSIFLTKYSADRRAADMVLQLT